MLNKVYTRDRTIGDKVNFFRAIFELFRRQPKRRTQDLSNSKMVLDSKLKMIKFKFRNMLTFLQTADVSKFVNGPKIISAVTQKFHLKTV